MSLTAEERQAILGTLLGDSSILYPHSQSLCPRVSFNHGGPQREWAEHKARFLHRLLPAIREHACGGYGERTVSVATSCLPCLREIHDLVYRGGAKKVVTGEWLDAIGPIGLAWWVADDGSSSGGGFTIHTEGFPHEQVEIIASWFGGRYGTARAMRTKRGYSPLYVSAKARRRMLPDVDQHVPPCMQYKLRSCRIRPKRPD